MPCCGKKSDSLSSTSTFIVPECIGPVMQEECQSLLIGTSNSQAEERSDSWSRSGIITVFVILCTPFGGSVELGVIGVSSV